MATERTTIVNDARRTNEELKELFNSMGNPTNPKGVIWAAYRQSHRALRDVIGRDALNEIPEIFDSLETEVREATTELVEQAVVLGTESAVSQLGALGVKTSEEIDWAEEYGTGEDYTPGRISEVWSKMVVDQREKSLALLDTGGDPIMIIGDDTRQGIVRPSIIVAAGAGWLAAMAALAWTQRTEPYEDKLNLMRQAIAAIDERTTDCCLRVHGQTIKMDGQFKLTGTPRYADKLKAPPFHDY